MVCCSRGISKRKGKQSEGMSMEESWQEPSRLQWFIFNFTYENLSGHRLPFPTSSLLSLHLETGWCGRLIDYLEAQFISLVFPCGVMKALLQRAVPATARQSPCCPQGRPVLQCPKEQLCPHLWGASQFLTSGESAHQPAQDLFVWEAKSSREFPPLALIETTNVFLTGGKLPMTLKRAVAWTMLKKASRHINSIISYRSAFFLSCLLVIKVLRAGAAPKNWIPSTRVLHPSLLPK